MIRSFSLENFKSFSKIRLTDLSTVNLIGGSNNVGKTSLLEGLFNYYDQLSPEILFRQFPWRGISSLTFKHDNTHEVWSPVFNDYDTKKKIIIKISDEKLQDSELTIKVEREEISSISRNNLQIDTDVSTGGTDSGARSILHLIGKSRDGKTLDSKIRLGEKGLEIKRNNQKIMHLPQAHFFNARTLNAKDDAIRFGELLKEGRDDLVVEALKEFEPKLKSISPIPNPDNVTILYANIGLTKKIPLNYLGDGITRLLAYSLAILTSKNGIVLIDEIENGFHYTKHNLIWSTLSKLAEDNNVQILSTTHSYEMAKSFNDICVNHNYDYSYYELFKNPSTKETMVNHLDPDTLKLKIISNKPFRGE